MSAPRWYVQTQPRAEWEAREHLRRRGFTTCLPKLSKSRRDARKIELVVRPLFPHYMFVLIDGTQQGWHSIRSTFGVSRLVGSEGGLIAVRVGIVETLRQREGANEYFRPSRLAQTCGAPVRILDGVFASCLGLFEHMKGKDRVAVLLNLLGRRVCVTPEAESVSAS